MKLFLIGLLLLAVLFAPIILEIALGIVLAIVLLYLLLLAWCAVDTMLETAAKTLREGL